MKTAPEAAEFLNVHIRTVHKWCVKLGIKTIGRDYLLSAAQVRRIGEHCYPGPGRPRNEWLRGMD